MMVEPLGDSWGAIWSTDDGRTWNRVPHDPALFGLTSGGGWTHIRDVVAGGPGFVAIGWNERVEPVSWVSNDGLSWQRSEYIATGDVFLDSVAALESSVVAIGHIGERSEPVIFVSENGLDWTPAFPAQGMSLTPESRPRVVARGDDFLAVVNGVWRSSDGFEWELVTNVMPTDFFEGQIASGPLGTVAISHSAKAVSMLGDGGEWTVGSVEASLDPELPFGADIELDGVLALDDGFVAMGSDYTNFSSETGGTVAVAYWSSDGLTWQRMNLEPFGGTNGRIRDAAQLHDSLIGIGFTASDGLSHGATWLLGANSG